MITAKEARRLTKCSKDVEQREIEAKEKIKQAQIKALIKNALKVIEKSIRSGAKDGETEIEYSFRNNDVEMASINQVSSQLLAKGYNVNLSYQGAFNMTFAVLRISW